MKLLHNPKTATEHRKRWPAAVAKVWTLEEAILDPPSTYPEHVFDYHDGLRVIAVLERYTDVHLHVSASMQPGSEFHRRIEQGKMTIERVLQIVVDRVKAISGRTVAFAFCSSGKGVPHFYDPPLGKEVM